MTNTADRAAGDGSRWVRRWPSGAGGDDPPVRLVCFPHAGGAATAFAPLARVLAGRIDVAAAQYPGRQERLAEPGLDSITALAEAIRPELRDLLDRPFALFGHSMGALVAFELASLLEHEPAPDLDPDPARAPLVGLFASGRRAPSTQRNENVHRGGDAGLLREVARLGGTPLELLADDDVQAMMLPALRADYKAIETYAWRPGPALECPIWALVGGDDPLTTEREAAAWGAHTTGTFELHTFPGGHFYLAEHWPEVADLVAAKLTPA
jgi:surfactin synthase thioesterase subunit